MHRRIIFLILLLAIMPVAPILTPTAFAVGDVSGNIFLDVDEDGIDDGAGEAGIPNVTVQLWNDVDASGTINSGDTVAASTITDSNGDYTFSAAADDDYVVHVNDALAKATPGVITTSAAARAFSVSGSNVTGKDIGFAVATYNISGALRSTTELNDSTTNGATLGNEDEYGVSVANIGDLDGDGVQDIAVGAPGDDNGGSNRGAIHIHYMNTDGSIDSTVEINDGTTNGPVLANEDEFGGSIASIGDLNGDGVQDIAVGASGDDGGSTDRGAIHILFMNTDGSVDSTVEVNDTTTNGPTIGNDDEFGAAIARVGDLDGDGVTEIAVGAPGDDNGGADRGAVHILFMNTNGSLDSSVEINDTTTNGPTLANADAFGSSLAALDDLDGDGDEDLVIGASGDDGTGTDRGAVYITYLTAAAAVDSVVILDDATTNGPSLANSDEYGASVANIGDLDGDSVVDIAVGASSDDGTGTDQGAVHVSFMNTNGSVDSTVTITGASTNGPTLSNEDEFGGSVAFLGDLNADGVADMVSGAKTDDNGGTDRGAIHIMNFALPAIAYTGSGFTETSGNLGAVSGSIIATLSNDTFQDTDADDVLDVNSEVTLTNVPAGFTAAIALTSSDTVATLTLTGNATNHLSVNSVSDIQFTFDDSAFIRNNGSNVTNATGPGSSSLGITFTGATTSDTTVKPTNTSVSINDGASCTASQDVTLSLSAEDAATVVISNDENFTGAETFDYATSIEWTLEEGEGEHEVFALFKSSTNTTSTAVSDTISLDSNCDGADSTDDDTSTDDDGSEEVDENSPTIGVDTAISPVTGEEESVTEVSAGDYIVGSSYDTVYYIDADYMRRPFMDAQTFFTWQDSFDDIIVVTDATLTLMSVGAPMLPKPGVVLVKIQSVPYVYALEAGSEYEVDLRWIPDEDTAEDLYGSDWADYIIDIPETLFSRFGEGDDMTGDESIDMSMMKTREELSM